MPSRAIILVDTTPLVALCDSRDSQHRAAVRHLQTLLAGDLRTCDAVIAEACFLLSGPSQRRRLRAVLSELAIAPAAGAGDMWFEVFDWLQKYADQEPDWADGCLAVLSERHPTARVWTYDREFRTTWRRPDGSAIPLAVAFR
jgi:predicted nucleic acid-binding protein